MKRKWIYSESRLAEVTGLSRAQLKTCRLKGEYRSGKGKGGPVELSQAGVDKVLEKYGIKDVNLDGARLGSTDGARGALDAERAARYNILSGAGESRPGPVVAERQSVSPDLATSGRELKSVGTRITCDTALLAQGSGSSVPPALSSGGVEESSRRKSGHPADDSGSPLSANAPPLSSLPDLKLVKVSQLVPNKRILKAQNGTGEIYSVIVPSSEQWAVGDPLRIKLSEKHQGYYQLVGPSPRNRGDRYYRLTFV